MKDRIAILTYDVPHRKTQDLLMMLGAYGFGSMDLLVTKFAERPPFQPLLSHRPIAFAKFSPNFMINQRINIPDDYDYDFSPYTYILIGGAGIIPEKVVQKNRIINSHPGWLPNVRGLDALKWALWKNEPIGVTTYFIGAEADTGVLIKRELTLIRETDTFYSLARRHYELEIQMLIESIGDEPAGASLGKRYNKDCEIPYHSIVHKRMPPSKEIHLEALLQERIRNADPFH